jgi:hypothetical protein
VAIIQEATMETPRARANRLSVILLAAAAAVPAGGAAQRAPADTLRVEVGSPEIDGRVFPDHSARNRVYLQEGAGPVNTWTNDLSVGDSAGLQVHRWVTRGVQLGPEGAGNSWELVQTYEARTLRPLTYYRWSSNGASMRLRIEGTRVRGVQLVPGEPTPRTIDRTLDRPGFFAGASDLVPMAARLRAGLVITAPVWAPNMESTEVRVFSVLGEETVKVEGADVRAWKVEERVQRTGALTATWYLTNSSPYMVLGEVRLPNGGIQRITGEAIEGPGAS